MVKEVERDGADPNGGKLMWRRGRRTGDEEEVYFIATFLDVGEDSGEKSTKENHGNEISGDEDRREGGVTL